MPEKLMPGCRIPGCRLHAVNEQRTCAMHETIEMRARFKKNLDKARAEMRIGTGDGFYNTKAWKALRTWHINHEPLCRACGGPGEMVDHIVSIQTGGEALDDSNLQTMCNACHASKRGREGMAARGLSD